MLEAAISPTVMLGIILFILIFFVVRIWLLQDGDDRRDDQERRQNAAELSFPFFDSTGSWVTRERRKRPDRRHVHTFIVSQHNQQPE